MGKGNKLRCNSFLNDLRTGNCSSPLSCVFFGDIRYLHEVCLPPVVHRNFKSANILLDEELSPHLSDCGLAALTPNTERQARKEEENNPNKTSRFSPFHSSISQTSFSVLLLQLTTQMVGSFGYSAPEFALSGVYTVKSDVYSFGVVMLELLTGREPLDRYGILC